MAYIVKDSKYNELIKFTGSGLYVADYPEIKDALVRMYKDIYGDDIDISTATADGEFLECMSLLVNNILQSIKIIYSNWNIETAIGSYLDNLCALTNVRRKASTHSSASLKITLLEAENREVSELVFVDKSGEIWEWKSNSSMTLVPNTPTSIIVNCITSGPVKAVKRSINKLLTTEINLKIEQEEDAVVGSYGETDSQLRSRRNMSLGSAGNSVLESMVNSLLLLEGIEDAKIYNNDTDDEIETKSGEVVKKGDVCVFLRKNRNVTLEPSVVGSLIYEKLTVGVGTHHGTGFDSYRYMQKYLGTTVDEESLYPQIVSYKVCEPLDPQITITLYGIKGKFIRDNDYTGLQVAEKVIEYMNSRLISEDVTYYDLYNVIYNADPLFKGMRTTIIDLASFVSVVGAVSSTISNPDSYFEYQVSNVEVSYGQEVVKNRETCIPITITISGEE